jgi:hypothetical protein
VDGTVFLPEQLQGNPFAFHLSPKIVKVGHYLAGSSNNVRWKQNGFQRAVIKSNNSSPVKPGLPDALQMLTNSCR